MTRKAIIVAVVAILALGTSTAFAFGVGSQTASDAAAVQETTTAAGQTTTAAATASVTFSEQTSNGTAVVVDRVVVPEGGFVVIHAAESTAGETTAVGTAMETETTAMQTETTAAGEERQQYAAGAVLGNSTYLEPGVHENVTVELDQPLEESQVLIAMPHRDTNDDQQYDFPEADDPYTEDGQAVTDPAFVTVEEVANETTAAATETTAAEA